MHVMVGTILLSRRIYFLFFGWIFNQSLLCRPDWLIFSASMMQPGKTQATKLDAKRWSIWLEVRHQYQHQYQYCHHLISCTKLRGQTRPLCFLSCPFHFCRAKTSKVRSFLMHLHSTVEGHLANFRTLNVKITNWPDQSISTRSILRIYSLHHTNKKRKMQLFLLAAKKRSTFLNS